ncbi:wall-associated receptor kinase 2-like protein, partial [Trifolium pratense]
YHKLLEELKADKIDLPDVFVVGALVEKLPSSWNDYKQQLKHKHTQISLDDLIKHVIIEDTGRKECDVARGKALESRANLIQNNAHQKRRYEYRTDHVLEVTNPTFKANCYVCGKPGHKAYHCIYRKTNKVPPKPKANLTLGDDKKDDDDDDDDDIIAAVISEVNVVSDVKKWVVDLGATRHICANKAAFTSYTSVGMMSILVTLELLQLSAKAK